MHESNAFLSSERKQVTVSAFWVGLGIVMSRGLGLLRDLMMAHFFSRTETDAWFVAFRLPNLFRRLFGEGALTVSFIPVLTDYLKNEDKQGAREFVSAVFTLLFICLSLLTVAGTVWAGPIVTAISHQGFEKIAGKLDLTIHQSQIMFCYIMLVSLYAFVMGILNTLRIFWLPAVAPALWNFTMIVGMLFFRETFSIRSDVLAWSSVVGGVLQLGILVPAIIKRHFLPRISFKWNMPAVMRVLKAMGPSIFGLSVMQLAVLINTHFASALEEGSNSWIFWADRLLELPLSLFAVSVGTAALPTMAAFWSRGDKKGMSDASLHALKLSFFMTIPCAIGLFVLATPIVRALFEHGKFTSHDTLMTAAVIRIYGLGVVVVTGVRVLAPSFYAMKNTWLPALAAAISLVCHVTAAIFLIKIFGIVGLAMSTVFSSAVNLTILLVASNFLIASFGFADLMRSLLKFSFGGIFLAVVAQGHHLLPRLLGDGHIARLINLGVMVVLAAATYFAVCWFLRVPELTETIEEFCKRINRRLGRRAS